MRRRLSSAVLLTTLAIAGGSYALARDAVFNQINSIVKTLSEISGLAEEHPVPYGRMNKNQLRKFLSKRIRKTLKPEEIEADELALKLFGLVPQSFDLKKSTIDLLTEQAAAFYDYDKKRLFLLDEPPGSDQVETLAHELSHALADQHFPLSKYMDDTETDDDANLARTAVVEGQASWLMIAYALHESGKNPIPSEETLKNAFDDETSSPAEYPVLTSSPLYIQQSLLFPYSQGVLFFDAVYRKRGKAAFREVFANPPADSAQILHPERYFGGVKATHPQLPALSVRATLEDVNEGTVGEFDHELLLWQYFDEHKAKALAPHLRGGHFRVVEVAPDGKPLLVYASEWDSPQNATYFFSAYQHILQKKWRGCDFTFSTETVLAGEGDNGYFVTRLSGDTVTSIEGISSKQDWDRLKTGAAKEPVRAALSAKMPFRFRQTPSH